MTPATSWPSERKTAWRPPRAVNVELARDSPPDAYIVTGRALDVLSRWARALRGEGRTRAWSITGPYGSGKSSLALFLAAVCAPRNTDAFRVAATKLVAADARLFDEIVRGREAAGVTESGLVTAFATAEHGPLVPPLARALADGIRRHSIANEPSVATEIKRLDMLALAGAGPGAQQDLVRCIAKIATRVPVVLVIDELGQALQFAAEQRRMGEFYLLQQIAEQASSVHDKPLFFFTIQHLSLADYAGAVGQRERREWSKVQGRFEEIPFVEGHDETIAIVERILADQELPRPAVDVGAPRAAVTDLGLRSLLPHGIDTIRATLPLHQIALLCLPYLCAAYGQRERSLFSFLQSDEPGSVRHCATSSDELVGLDVVYDYLVHSVRSTSDFTPGVARWLEIDRRIRETIGLAKDDIRLLKTIGALNLVSQGGSLRASRGLLAYAMNPHAVCPEDDSIEAALSRFAGDSMLTYRAFADEYRIWSGTDFDLALAGSGERSLLEMEPPSRVIELALDPEPVVATRHTQRTGIYRYFDAVFLDARSSAEIPGSGSGVVAYWVDLQDAQVPEFSRPTIIVHAANAGTLRDACLEAASLQRVLSNRRHNDLDWVARQELVERLEEARARARAAFSRVFDLRDPSVTLTFVGLEATARGSRLTRIVSDACDSLYPSAPEVRSEMLSRDEITKQAARARRDLLEALVTHESIEGFGIVGYGPERALYEAIFRHGGLHRESEPGVWEVGTPATGAPFGAVWRYVEEAVLGSSAGIAADVLEGRLRQPPFGLPRSVAPILISAFLVARPDEVGVFQEGTFQPILSVDLIERLIKIPARFTLRSFAPVDPRHRAVVEALTSEFGFRAIARGPRNSSILGVVVPLMRAVPAPPPFVLGTARLEPRAKAVRQVLSDIREPDRLLFEELPAACGYPELSSQDDADSFSKALGGSIRELNGRYNRLLADCQERLSLEFGVPQAEMRFDLGVRSRALRHKGLDARLQAFVSALSDSTTEDREWLANVCLAVSGRAPMAWTDRDEDRFGLELHRFVPAFKGAEVLSFGSEGAGRDTLRLVTITSPDGVV